MRSMNKIMTGRANDSKIGKTLTAQIVISHVMDMKAGLLRYLADVAVFAAWLARRKELRAFKLPSFGINVCIIINKVRHNKHFVSKYGKNKAGVGTTTRVTSNL